ncbi:MAG: alpha/beta hydrolase [Terracidiphilus sp.]
MPASRLLSIFLFSLAAALGSSLCAAETYSAPQLVKLAIENSPDLSRAIEESFSAQNLKEGTAWSGRLHDFFFALRSSSAPTLFIDDAPGLDMKMIPGTDLWFASEKIEVLGHPHTFHYRIDGKVFGGSNSLPAFSELSYPMPGVKQGTLPPKMTATSRIYDGMKADWWIYVPAGYDANVPAALMVFQDGGGYINHESSRTLDAIDNLIALKKIPYMICVFINSGSIDGPPGNPTDEFVKAYSEKWRRNMGDSMRSTEYDTVSNRYPRYLQEEILPPVQSKYNIRQDAYSHAITGLSSGGICSFNAAWQMPDLFSRVITWIGSFTAIQWKETPGVPDGGQDYPDKILRETHRNIRVWLQDGSDDLEWNQYGSWAPDSIRMANALKLKGYDFHLSFGKGGHNTAHGESEFPQEMIWLWRDYDPAKTEQTFETEPSEMLKPVFRIGIVNRDAN